MSNKDGGTMVSLLPTTTKKNGNLKKYVLLRTLNNTNYNNSNNDRECGITTTTNSFMEVIKSVGWSCRQLHRKQLCGILALIVLLLYANSTLLNNEVDDRIPVIHYSHVPGMKASMIIRDNASMAATATTINSKLSAKIAAQPQIFYKNVSICNHINTITTTPISTTTTTSTTKSMTNKNDDSDLPPTGYLVWSKNCRMPNIDPYKPEVMKYFKREKYKPCSTINPLTSLDYNKTDERYILYINEKTIPYYSKTGIISCCYHVIERNLTGTHADKDVSLAECISFKNKTKLLATIDNILVRCKAKNKQIYVNAHAMLPIRPEIVRRQRSAFPSADANNRPPSVLMIGIDSISRINLIRAMPKTAQYLYDNDWFEMSGYNKIDDNTFPNLMAVLTGRNISNAYKSCPPVELGGLDKCNFIWRTYQQHGYVTAYAEDECAINTFNYYKVGFEKPPVDYYLRPFLLTAEKHLTVKLKSNLIYCLGYKHAAEHVYDYAVELARRYSNSPYFGLFWANTFSHNAISDSSSMDERMLDYMKKFDELGTLNNTIVIFFSDHGIRFGPTRKTNSGHYEERLPFLFIWLPPAVRVAHIEFVNALKINKNRLTNPYDLYMTLKDVLNLASPSANVSAELYDELKASSAACPRCQTLFEVVPHNRSCEEISIADHWCTCIPFKIVAKDSKLIHKLTQGVIDYINNYVHTFRNGTFMKKCAQLSLQNVEYAYQAQYLTEEQKNPLDTYRIIFYTKPNKGLFESTVRHNVTSGALDITGEISRLNSYATDSECVEDGAAKKYCSCRRKNRHG